MTELELTLDQFIEELRKAEEEAGRIGEGVTVTELMDRIQWSRYKMRKVIAHLRLIGRVEPVYLWRENDWGEPQKLKGYRLVSKSEIDNEGNDDYTNRN